MMEARLPRGSALRVWGIGLQATVRFLLRLWDAVSIYLPIVLMGLLALATYWMVQRTPVYVEPDLSPKAQTQEVDFFMRGAVIKSFGHDGRLQNQLSGREIRHYGDGKAVEIDQPKFWASDEQSRVMTAVAQWAWVRDDGSRMELKGQALVVREPWRGPDGQITPRQELRGELLIVDTQEEWVRSPGPAVLISDQNRFTGDSLVYDHRTRVAEFKGRVRATLVPR
jgi:lipopolysaccharide export system protein LptC